MSFTNEQILKAKAAKSVEELLALAKENGVELSEEEAKKYFAEWHREGELSDEELQNISGGCGTPDPKYYAGQILYTYSSNAEYRIFKWLGYDSEVDDHIYQIMRNKGAAFKATPTYTEREIDRSFHL